MVYALQVESERPGVKGAGAGGRVQYRVGPFDANGVLRFAPITADAPVIHLGGRFEGRRQSVKQSNERSRSVQPVVGRELSASSGVAGREGEDLASGVVGPEHMWCGREAFVFEKAKEGVDRRRPRSRRTPNRVADAHDAFGVHA